MGRQPTGPRYRKGRDTWYVQIDGKQVTLAKGEKNKKAAWAEFRRLMSERDRPVTGPPAHCVGWVAAKYLEHLKRRRDHGEIEAGSRKDALRRLADFPDRYLLTPVADLKPHHVADWLDTHPEWGPTTRHDAVAAVKACLRWAKDAGHVDADPLASVKKPKRARRREQVIDAAQWPNVRAAIRSEAFGDLVDFLYGTGARPGEAFRLEARHVDTANGVAVLGAAEHKSGRKTGKTRAVYLTGRAAEVVAKLAERHPEGPIFRSAKGNAWNKNSVNCQVRAIRARSGAGREFVAYSLRHLFATDALDKGVGVETVAKLLGHSDSRMVSTVYSRLDERHDHFREALEKVRGSDGTVE